VPSKPEAKVNIDLPPLTAAPSDEYHLTALEVHGTDANNIENRWVLLAHDSRNLQVLALGHAHPSNKTSPAVVDG
jgi:hypothetical protein